MADRSQLALVAAAPVLLLGSTVAYIANGEGMNKGEVGGTLQLWAFVCFAVASVTLTERFRDRAPRAAAALLVVGMAGAAGGVAYAIDSVQAGIFDTSSIQESGSAVAPLALQLPGGLFPLGLAAIGVMLLRTSTAPAWPARLLVVGAILFPMSRIPDIEAIALTSDLLLIVSLGAIAFKLGAAPSDRRVEAGAGRPAAAA